MTWAPEGFSGGAALGGRGLLSGMSATADSAINPGTIVTIVPGSVPVRVEPATTGEPVFGICTSGAGAAGDRCDVATRGTTWLLAAPTADWATAGHNKVVAGSGGLRVYEGNDGDPWFATLIEHDTSGSIPRALVQLNTDAEASLGRGVVDNGGATFTYDDLSDGETLAVSSGQIVTRSSSGGTRPSSPATGQTFYDTDLEELIVWNGTRWQSTIPHLVLWGRTQNNSAGLALGCHYTLTGNDSGLPFFFHHDARVLTVRFAIRGGTGGQNWIPRLRLDGSGSNAWSGTTRSSTTSWQSFSDDVGLDVTEGQRIRPFISNTGSNENIQLILDMYYVHV